MKNRLLEKEENRAIAAQVQLQREQLPPEQSKALGEAARSRVPRESHSTFSLPSERENPVALLEAQAKMRISETPKERRYSNECLPTDK